MKAATPTASTTEPTATAPAAPADAGSTSARPALNPAAAWPFPTGSRP
jgi:hypothetical protein